MPLVGPVTASYSESGSFGSLVVSGNISGSTTSTGSFGKVDFTHLGGGNLTFDGSTLTVTGDIDPSDASTSRTNLGVAIGSDVQAYDAQLADVAGLAVTDSSFIVGDGSNFVLENASTSRTSLGFTSPILNAASPGAIGGTSPSAGTFTTCTLKNGTGQTVLSYKGDYASSHTILSTGMGAYVFAHGSDPGMAGGDENAWCDIVIFHGSSEGGPNHSVIHSFTGAGSPTSRTWSTSGNDLNLSLGESNNTSAYIIKIGYQNRR